MQTDNSRCSQSDNGIDPVLDQFLRQLAELIRIAICELPLKSNVLSFGVTKLT